MKNFKSLFLILVVAVSMISVSCKRDTTIDPATTDALSFANASAAKGGMLFDKFWAIETGYDQTSTNIAAFNAKSDFYRCKQCHAWDLLGNSGSYIGRAPKTNRPRVAGVSLMEVRLNDSPRNIFDEIKGTTGKRSISFNLATYDPATNAVEGDKMPDLSTLLTDAQIWDLVKFIKEGAFDVSKLYDAIYTGTYPTGKAVFSNIGKDGNATTGDAYFAARCVPCHGADGTKLHNLDGAGYSLGSFLRNKPNETQHKVKFGLLGTPMTAFGTSEQEMKDLYKALTNNVKYPD
ncbi:MAG: c-type cytochrome [Bacteroidota bacterium]